MTGGPMAGWVAARTVLALVICFVVTAPVHAADRRIALIIGNSAYKDAPLPNPGNDARAVAQALRNGGFTVIERRNVNQAALRRAIREFGDELAKGGVGLFYYAGHGMQVKGRNYLIPVGHDIQREDEVAEQSVEVGLVLEKMASAKNKLNVVILDACRNNPFGGAGGLAPIDAPAGTLIAYSTAPGQVAADGTGDNGTYTKHLAIYMREPGLRIEDVFKRTRSAVRQETKGRQIPWENTSLETDFYFTLPDSRAVASDDQERRKEQQAAIEKAVQEALRKRSDETAKDRAQIERQIAERVAAERASAERAAAQRIAAVEREAQAAIERAMQRQGPAPAVTAAAQPQPAAAGKAQPATESPPAVKEPVRVAAAPPAGTTRGIVNSSVKPRVGDSWTYVLTERDYGEKKETKFRRTVEAVTDTEIRMRAGNGDLVVYNHDGNLVRRENKNGEVRTWEPYQPLLRHPLDPGATWEQKFVYKRPNFQVENDAVGTVVGWEEVSVPAGTFKALKVTYVSWYRRLDNNSRGRTAITVWFAPELKRWVKLSLLERGSSGTIYSDSTEELAAFNLK